MLNTFDPHYMKLLKYIKCTVVKICSASELATCLVLDVIHHFDS